MNQEADESLAATPQTRTCAGLSGPRPLPHAAPTKHTPFLKWNPTPGETEAPVIPAHTEV